MLLDESTGNRLVVQDRVQDEFLDLWRDLVGDQLICQIKLFAMVPVRWEWQLELSNRRVLLFVDNNSARSGVVKGRSDSPTMDDSIKAFHSIEVHLPSFWWVERVPNKSNPGDEPSRFEGKASAARWNAQFLPGFEMPSQSGRLVDQNCQPEKPRLFVMGKWKPFRTWRMTTTQSHIQTDGSGDLSPGLSRYRSQLRHPSLILLVPPIEKNSCC